MHPNHNLVRTLTFEQINAVLPHLRPVFNMDDLDIDLEDEFVLLLMSAPLQNLVYTIPFEQINAVLPDSQK